MCRTRTLSWVALVLITGALAVAVPGSAASRSKSPADRFWVTPDIASYPVTAVAMLPPVLYEDNSEVRKQVESAVGQALKGSGHRWVSPFLVRDYLLKAGGDSLLKAINLKLMKNPRLDSLDAPLLSRALRARAILTVRVDRMERHELEAGQSGRPSTTVELRAALVDSTGRLLWTAYSNETVEGTQQEAETSLTGVKAMSLGTESSGRTSSAPVYPEVLAKVCQRWTELFPRRAAPDTSSAGR